MGEKGCLFKNHEETIVLPGHRVDAVDATGAGDSFIAAFAVCRCEGAAIREALEFANACGAICTTKIGATSALIDRKQVIDMMKRT